MDSELRICPRCASPLAWRSFEYDNIKHPACAACGFVLWQNPKTCADALIVRQRDGVDELLLGHHPRFNLEVGWDTPGGYLNYGDEIERAVIRECRREMGVDVEVGDLLGAYEDVHLGAPIIVLVYICELKAGEPRAADIIDAVRWFPLAGPPGLAYPAIERAVAALQARLGLSQRS